MQDYKELLNANKNLSTIKPKPSEYMCTYQNDEMFVIEETNARVSIDGSIDLLNKIDQKLSSGVRKTRLEEVYEEDRSKTLKFKCLLKYFIDNREVCASESPFLTEKKKSKSYSTLKLIESLYEQGYINPNLEPEIVQFSQSNILKRKREQKIQEFRDDKLKNKEAGNKEEVNIDIESEFLLAQDTEIHKQTNNTYSIIHCVPDENNEFPFPKNLKLKNIHNETLNKSIGFLSDPDHIPNSESFELFVRGEQIDRIRHFLNNTNKKFYSDASESDKSRRKQGSNSKEIINNDIKVKYNI